MHTGWGGGFGVSLEAEVRPRKAVISKSGARLFFSLLYPPPPPPKGPTEARYVWLVGPWPIWSQKLSGALGGVPAHRECILAGHRSWLESLGPSGNGGLILEVPSMPGVHLGRAQTVGPEELWYGTTRLSIRPRAPTLNTDPWYKSYSQRRTPGITGL